MGIDSDDRLLREGKGLNENHEKKFRESVLNKKFLTHYSIAGVSKPESAEYWKYHYTSPEGLKGILTTRTFYFTDSQFLNDYREKVNINEELGFFWMRNLEKYDREFANIIRDFVVSQYEDSGFSYIDNGTENLCRYFVLSLSTDGDSLSMWKYYTKTANYNGYCLELNSMPLMEEWIDRITGAAVEGGRITYQSEKKQEQIKCAVDRLYSIWKSYERSDKLDEKIRKEYISWISVKALFFKDQCFEDEKEMRYVAIVPVEKLNNLSYEYKGTRYKMYDFRILNGVFIPYIKMPFNDWNRDTCWAINGIRIGPSDIALQKEAGLRQFIRSLDYDFYSCNILHSDVPVRY